MEQEGADWLKESLMFALAWRHDGITARQCARALGPAAGQLLGATGISLLLVRVKDCAWLRPCLALRLCTAFTAHDTTTGARSS